MLQIKVLEEQDSGRFFAILTTPHPGREILRSPLSGMKTMNAK
jgi:hypothetical protein